MAVKSLIETVTVGAGGVASIEFTAIPQDGSDLVCVTSLRSDRASQTVDGTNIEVNGTAANRSEIFLSASFTGSVSSGTDTKLSSGLANATLSTSNTFSNASVYISNYSGSTAKSFSSDGVLENNDTAAFSKMTAGLWNDTSAITSLKIVSSNSATLLQYSTASLYKIKYD